MGATLCRHELPENLCDVCTPREPQRRVVTQRAQSAQPKVENPDTVIVAANLAYGEYLKFNAYVCQPDRAFRQDTRWMGFYAQEAIQVEIAEILYVRDRVPFTRAEVERLQDSHDPVAEEVARLIELAVVHSGRRWDQDFKVFLLSGPNDSRTHKLPKKTMNNLLDHKGTGTAFTQHQRYSRLDFLERGPRYTDELVNMGHVTDDQTAADPDQ